MASQSLEIQEKIRQTNLQCYGVDNPFQSSSVKERIRQTNLQRYGVEHPLQSLEIQERVKQTNIARYGVEYASQSEEIQEKIRQTNLERYGVGYIFQSSSVKERGRQTSIERYGVEHPSQAEEVKEKIRQTNQERYGVEYPVRLGEVRSKARQTNLERYGVENPFQSEEIKQKIRQTNLEHFGTEHPMQSEEMRERVRQTNLERYGVECTLQAEFVKEKSRQTNLAKYGVEYACQRPEARKSSSNSAPNLWFSSVLVQEGIEFEREFPLKRFSYDFRVGNILIEINPSITHNILWVPFGDHAPYVSLDYHMRKSQIADNAGFHCIHIFDWDDQSKIVQFLKLRPKIYARKCELREVPVSECDEFLNLYHLQNTCRGQIIRLGLYEADTLISVMTFGAPRYNKNFQYELLRYCAIKNVTGGAERLFRHFLQDFQPESIISYCDFSKFRGRVYERLGFALKEGEITPSRHWYYVGSAKNGEGIRLHITDNLLRQRGFDQLFHTFYGKGTSNEELMIARGYLPIYDCGQGVYIWRKS